MTSVDRNTVLVLGAGLTKALVPAAPLIRGDFGVPALCQEFATFASGRSVLENAQIPGTGGEVDLERLLTRLMGMPYDPPEARHEFALVTSRLLQSLNAKIEAAKVAGIEQDLRAAFANLAVEKEASIVTFNYDDVVDEALYVLRPFYPWVWHPDGGYGFFCRPSRATVTNEPLYMNDCATLLLKLHGSLNWRCELGSPSPRAPETVLHHESWFTEQPSMTQVTASVTARITEYLEPDALIVPPVLAKNDLSIHPVLRLVWARARAKLADATRVIFLGYSFPTTDLAAQTLFQETLAHRRVEVEVVNHRGPRSDPAALEARYRELFSPLVPTFDFGGAAEWIKRNDIRPAGTAAASPASPVPPAVPR